MSFLTERPGPPSLVGDAWHRGDQHSVPTELRHFLRRGLQEDPALRPANAEAALDDLQAIRNGDVRVQCPVTLQRRMLVGWQRALDRHPWLSIVAPLSLLALVVGLGVSAIG